MTTTDKYPPAPDSLAQQGIATADHVVTLWQQLAARLEEVSGNGRLTPATLRETGDLCHQVAAAIELGLEQQAKLTECTDSPAGDQPAMTPAQQLRYWRNKAECEQPGTPEYYEAEYQATVATQKLREAREQGKTAAEARAPDNRQPDAHINITLTPAEGGEVQASPLAQIATAVSIIQEMGIRDSDSLHQIAVAAERQAHATERQADALVRQADAMSDMATDIGRWIVGG